MKNFYYILLLFGWIIIQACSSTYYISKTADQDVLQTKELQSAHVGICLYEPAASRYWYSHQDDKYFVPASNTKLFSLYAGMKYLGDSLTGIGYIETDTAVFLIPTGDPTLLHPDFKMQPVIDFLKKIRKNIYVIDRNWKEEALGTGWSWDDYNDDYMAERSPLPVYGNVIKWVEEKQGQAQQDRNFSPSPVIYSIPEVNWKVLFDTAKTRPHFFVKRKLDENVFEISEGNEMRKEQDVPFVTGGLASALELLRDTVGKEIFIRKQWPPNGRAIADIHSQPTDSLFIPMMHRSDNFFAEQTLLMVSNKKLGLMNDRTIIDTLLKTDFRDLPQKPQWADGSGLSRFNLFTPRDIVWLLDKMKNEFGIDRLKHILATAGTGTLRSFNKQDSGYVFAKTGSLNGVLCLSGYLYTKKNRLLLFSIMVNNHNGGTTAIRKSFENFLVAVRQKY